MNWHNLKLGDLVRGTYLQSLKKKAWLGIITDREGNWLEITWNDGGIDQYDLGDMDGTQELRDHWEVVSENR